jgi:hypothetical protein
MQVLVQFIENLSNRHTKVDCTEIENMQPRDREHILYTLDAMIRDVKTRKAYSS